MDTDEEKSQVKSQSARGKTADPAVIARRAFDARRGNLLERKTATGFALAATEVDRY